VADERRLQVLELAVGAFVASNRPVASRDLAGAMGVSSATVRFELAALEEMGLLHQPHTSAGRVPTLDAYRAYAHRFIPAQSLPEADQARLANTLGRTKGTARLRLAARLASSLSGYAAVAVLAQEAKVEAIYLNPIGEERVLVVVLFENGVAEEFVIALDFRVERTLFERAGEVLRDLHLALFEVPARLRQLEASSSPSLAALLALVRQSWGEASPPSVFAAGASQVLSEPESQNTDFLRRVLAWLERPLLPMQSILPGQMQLAFGDPQGLAAVAAGFRSSFGQGHLAIVGPLRMRYPQAIQVAKAVSDALGLA
jgi:heat-inducible transcriptional repressor